MVNQCRLPQPLKAASCFRQEPHAHLVPIAFHAGCAGGGGRRLHTGAAGGVPGERPRRGAGRHAPPAAGGAAVRRRQVRPVFPAIFSKRFYLCTLPRAPHRVSGFVSVSHHVQAATSQSAKSAKPGLRAVIVMHCSCTEPSAIDSLGVHCSCPRKCFQVECQANDILSVMSQAALCWRCQAGRDALPGAARSVRCQIRHHFQGADPTMLVQLARKFGAVGRQTTSVICVHAAHDMQNRQLQGCHMSPHDMSPNPRS